MRRNSELVFDPGNQFGSLSSIPPYFGIPGWWRRFIFRVLSHRDIAIYVYLCSLMDHNDICYPTTKQIRAEIGVDSPTTIFSALRQLEDLGFILRRRRRLPGRAYQFQRNIYQRPAPEFTLHSLLSQERIDGRLCPINQVSGKIFEPEMSGRSDRVVETGLKNLLGDKYVIYDEASEDQKSQVLSVLLQERLDDRRSELGPKTQAEIDAAKTDTGVFIGGRKYRVREADKLNQSMVLGDDSFENEEMSDDEIPF